MFWSIYLAVLFASWAMSVREGFWSNAISLVTIIASGLVAFGFYSPLAIYFDEMTNGQYTYVVDFLCIWALFVVAMLVLRSLFRLASATRLRFKHPIDPVGGPLVGLISAWVMAAFVMATLHTAPMPKEAFSGGLVHNESEVASQSGLTAPDLGWLRFVERVTGPDALGKSEQKGFRAGAFVQIYADHREKFANAKAKWIKVRRG